MWLVYNLVEKKQEQINLLEAFFSFSFLVHTDLVTRREENLLPSVKHIVYTH